MLLVELLPVEEPPPVIDDREPEFQNLELVMTSLDRGLTALAESLLQAADIPYLVQGEYHSCFCGYALPMRFLVPEEYAAEAREALRDLL